MRKLKLQMQMSLDGFVAGPNGELDWMVEEDESMSEKIQDPADSCDIILMGRKMTPDFIDHWESRAPSDEPKNSEQRLAQRMVNMRKIVFSRTQKSMKGRNLEVENGDLATTVQRLKTEQGKDMIVYGGAGFVSALIGLNLVDEYYIFVNPVAIGNGLSIFKEKKGLKLATSTTLKNGTVFNKYLPILQR